MTNFRFLILVFCFCRNDEILSFRNLSEKTETALPSFPRRRESRT
ncbi:pilS cassette [Neisseria meningitidis]|nr:pilS cassette [Neisseria meningitidis]